MAIERLKDRILSCMYCSECIGRGPTLPFVDGDIFTPEWICPEVDALKFTGYSGRGQQHIAREILYGNLEIDEDVVKTFNACTNCRICANLCIAPLHETVMAMREEIFEKGYEYLPEGSKRINNNISQAHNAFGAPNEKRKVWASEFKFPEKGEYLYFVGCYTSWRHPSIARAAVKILRRLGIDVMYMGEDEWCCGLPCWAHGNKRVKEEMIKHNIEEITKRGAKRVIFSCAYCYRTFKMVYPEVVGALPFTPVHITSLLKEMINGGHIRFERELEERVTYHDPCILIRGYLGERGDMYGEPRDIISRLPGISFKEMRRTREWAYCCGGGATVTSSSYPSVRDYIGASRLNEAKEVADVVYTICPHCIDNFSVVARSKNIDIKVKDLTEAVAQAMGLSE